MAPSRFSEIPFHGPAAPRKAAAVGIGTGLLALGITLLAKASLPEQPAASSEPKSGLPSNSREILGAHGLNQIESFIEGRSYFTFSGPDRKAAETALKALGYSRFVWHDEQPNRVWVDTKEPSGGR